LDILGSYLGKISKWKIILSAVLISAFLLLICMSLLLKDKAYYIFVTSTPLGTLLYFAVMLRYLGEPKAAIIFDILYLLILLGMICCVAISIKKRKAIRFVYAISIFDMLVCLLLFSASKFLGEIVGDIVIITVAIITSRIRNKTGDGFA